VRGPVEQVDTKCCQRKGRTTETRQTGPEPPAKKEGREGREKLRRNE